MNWVGGARKRVKLQKEKKLQKEFFERKKFENHSWNKSKRAVSVRQNLVSQDLLALETVNKMAVTGSDVPKTVRRLDLDQFRSVVCGRKYNEVELPPSPNETPSLIGLYENGRSSDERSSSGRFYSTKSTHVSQLNYGSGFESSNSISSSSTKKLQYPKTNSRLEENFDRCHHKTLKQNKTSRNNYVSNPFEQDSFDILKIAKLPQSSVLERNPVLKQQNDCLKKYKAYSQDVLSVQRARNPCFNPFVTEDFQTTPLVNYEMKDNTKSFVDKHSIYNSLKDQGYITDNERFHNLRVQPKHSHSMKPIRKVDVPVRKPLEVSFVDNISQRPKQWDIDMDDDYIENRFRKSKCKNQISDKTPRRLTHNFEDASEWTWNLPHSGVDKGQDKEDYSCIEMTDFRTVGQPLVHRNSSRFSQTLDILKEDVKVSSPKGSGSNSTVHGCVSAAIQLPNSPPTGDPFPESLIQNHWKVQSSQYDEREIQHSLSTDPLSVLCSENKSCCSQGKMSDFNKEKDACGQRQTNTVYLSDPTQDLQLLCWRWGTLSPPDAAFTKTSEIEEIFDELRQLEYESEGDLNTEKENIQREADAAEEMSSQMKFTNSLDEICEEVGEVLGELVHKVVLLNSKSIEDFVVPSCSVVTTSQHNFMSLYQQDVSASAPDITLQCTLDQDSETDFKNELQEEQCLQIVGDKKDQNDGSKIEIEEIKTLKTTTNVCANILTPTICEFSKFYLNSGNVAHVPHDNLADNEINPARALCLLEKHQLKDMNIVLSTGMASDDGVASVVSVNSMSHDKGDKITTTQTVTPDCRSEKQCSKRHNFAQTDTMPTKDAGTSPVMFRYDKVDIGTQYENQICQETLKVERSSKELVHSSSLCETCGAQLEYVDSKTIDASAFSDATAGYSLRSRRKEMFPLCII